MKMLTPSMKGTLLRISEHGPIDILDIRLQTLCALASRGMTRVIYPKTLRDHSTVELTKFGVSVVSNMTTLERAPGYFNAMAHASARKRLEKGAQKRKR